MTPPAYADCSHSDEVKIDNSDDCQKDFHMHVEFTERERLDIENRLLREMAARYARLMEKEKADRKAAGSG